MFEYNEYLILGRAVLEHPCTNTTHSLKAAVERNQTQILTKLQDCVNAFPSLDRYGNTFTYSAKQFAIMCNHFCEILRENHKATVNVEAYEKAVEMFELWKAGLAFRETGIVMMAVTTAVWVLAFYAVVYIGVSPLYRVASGAAVPTKAQPLTDMQAMQQSVSELTTTVAALMAEMKKQPQGHSGQYPEQSEACTNETK